jgi:hypothetical protein
MVSAIMLFELSLSTEWHVELAGCLEIASQTDLGLGGRYGWVRTDHLIKGILLGSEHCGEL